MKSIVRFLLGIGSSALLAVGLVRAADHLDPMNQSLPAVGSTTTGSAPTCSNECFFTTKDI
jgi:hypothetical protein